jgi:N-acetylglucosamine-1-phosphate transferase gamma subunit
MRKSVCFLLLFLFLLAFHQAIGKEEKKESKSSSEKLKGEKGGKPDEKGDKKTSEKGDVKGEKHLNKTKGDSEKGKEKKVEKLPLKIVDNPVTPRGTGYNSWSQAKQITLSVKPGNLTGPPPFKSLAGKCFSLTVNNYKYEMCPFDNVTQKEQTSRWNAYSGALGVWKEWVIEVNSFVGWLMPNGDSCGSKTRQTKVLLVCGKENSVVNVSEPKTCEYVMEFRTPLACSRRNMAVYPWLSVELQEQWDNVERERFNRDITEQGYKRYLTTIWKSAGLVGQTVKRATEKPSEEKKNDAGKSDELAECRKANNRLQQEIEQLKQQLAVFIPAINVSYSNQSLSNSTGSNATQSVNQTGNDPLGKQGSNATQSVNQTGNDPLGKQGSNATQSVNQTGNDPLGKQGSNATQSVNQTGNGPLGKQESNATQSVNQTGNGPLGKQGNGTNLNKAKFKTETRTGVKSDGKPVIKSGGQSPHLVVKQKGVQSAVKSDKGEAPVAKNGKKETRQDLRKKEISQGLGKEEMRQGLVKTDGDRSLRPSNKQRGQRKL